MPVAKPVAEQVPAQRPMPLLGQGPLERLFRTWAKEKALDPARLTFDNDAPGFLDAFPASDAPGVDENYLVEHLWWWRHTAPESCQEIFQHRGWPEWHQVLQGLFEDHFEPSAYFYEFRARYDERYDWDFDRPWVLCSLEQRRMLDCYLPSEHPARNYLQSDVRSNNWAKVPERWVNLQLNDSVLVEQFQAEIEQLRESKSIPRPAKGKGIRRRDISWRSIEMMDARYYKMRVLNASERSQLSKETKAYEQICEQLNLTP